MFFGIALRPYSNGTLTCPLMTLFSSGGVAGMTCALHVHVHNPRSELCSSAGATVHRERFSCIDERYIHHSVFNLNIPPFNIASVSPQGTCVYAVSVKAFHRVIMFFKLCTCADKHHVCT